MKVVAASRHTISTSCWLDILDAQSLRSPGMKCLFERHGFRWSISWACEVANCVARLIVMQSEALFVNNILSMVMRKVCNFSLIFAEHEGPE